MEIPCISTLYSVGQKLSSDAYGCDSPCGVNSMWQLTGPCSVPCFSVAFMMGDVMMHDTPQDSEFCPMASQTYHITPLSRIYLKPTQNQLDFLLPICLLAVCCRGLFLDGQEHPSDFQPVGIYGHLISFALLLTLSFQLKQHLSSHRIYKWQLQYFQSLSADLDNLYLPLLSFSMPAVFPCVCFCFKSYFMKISHQTLMLPLQSLISWHSCSLHHTYIYIQEYMLYNNATIQYRYVYKHI